MHNVSRRKALVSLAVISVAGLFETTALAQERIKSLTKLGLQVSNPSSLVGLTGSNLRKAILKLTKVQLSGSQIAIPVIIGAVRVEGHGTRTREDRRTRDVRPEPGQHGSDGCASPRILSSNCPWLSGEMCGPGSLALT